MSEALWGVAIGGAIGVAGTIIGVLVDSWLRRREREADVRERRRQEAARVVGPALAALRDLEPNSNVAALAGNPRADEAMEKKWDTWLAASGGLEVLAAEHPDSEVAQLCESVIANGGNLMNRLQFAIIAHPDQPQSEAWWAEVRGIHEWATADARQLVRAVVDQPA